MNKLLLFTTILLCSPSAFAQKLPCTVADINAALSENDKKVTDTSQYLLIDIDADGVKDIVYRDSDDPSACYAVLLCKKGKLEVENFAFDGYETLGYAKGGYSFYQHDDHMGPSGRTWEIYFSRYANGKEVLTGNSSFTSISEDDDDMEVSESYTINKKAVSAKEYEKVVPEPIWFGDIKDGWRMVKNNQLAVTYSQDKYDIYSGNIGDYPVTLCFDKNKHDGFYFYQSRPENKFTLKCVCSKPLGDNEVQLQVKEYIANGTNTGTFVGKYRKGSSFSGTFTNSEGKSFDFSLDNR